MERWVDGWNEPDANWVDGWDYRHGKMGGWVGLAE